MQQLRITTGKETDIYIVSTWTPARKPGENIELRKIKHICKRKPTLQEC